MLDLLLRNNFIIIDIILVDARTGVVYPGFFLYIFSKINRRLSQIIYSLSMLFCLSGSIIFFHDKYSPASKTVLLIKI